MANRLSEITDLVLKEVIKNEVILPSTYKEHFDNHAREMQIDLNYEEIVNKATQDRLNQANELMDKTYCNLDSLAKSAKDAQDAIEEKDADKLALVAKDIAELKIAIGSLKKQLHTDVLTSVYNRKWLSENILHEGSFTFDGTLIFVDLDDFMPTNNKYGHVIGDKVLQYLAGYLKSSLKDMDVVRYAGDEFIVISKNEQMETCYMRMKKLQEDLLSKKLKATNGELLYLSFSFGLTRFEVGSSFRDVIEVADSLMRENKKNKREIQ